MTTIARDFNISQADAFAYKDSRALRSGAEQPSQVQEQIDRANKATLDKLVNFHERSAADGYFQSHPFGQMFTAQDLATDEATLSNNYMRLIFGGKTDPDKDMIAGAYKHALKQRAEAAVTQGSVLENMNPLDFVEGKQDTKDAVLQTFAEQRRFFKGQIDTDAERAMKARVGHEIIETTFYGKNVHDNGMAGRFHYTTGQHGHLQYRQPPADTKSWWSLSSRTYAPDGEGGEVPLMIQNQLGLDPRTIPIDSNEVRVVAPDPANTYNFNDIGLYPGKEIDAHIDTVMRENPTFDQRFKEPMQRRWV